MKGAPFDPKGWVSEFKAWAYRLGGVPMALLTSHERSESAYELDRAHVFKVRPGRYALVIEYGCSCYELSNAEIFIYGDERSAMKDYHAWRETSTCEFYSTGVKAEE